VPRNACNRAGRSALKAQIRKVREAIKAGDLAKAETEPAWPPELDTAATKADSPTPPRGKSRLRRAKAAKQKAKA
jgi:ribosomal protein S20